jgi:hypothetical protein
MFMALGAALACNACGGSDQRSAEEPSLPRALASDLAETSEAIADALDAGDVCGAAQLADELKNAVDAAVASGQVPAELEAELEGTVLELQNGVNCTAEPEEQEEEDEGEKDKGKKKGHDKDDDGVTLSTTTEED